MSWSEWTQEYVQDLQEDKKNLQQQKRSLEEEVIRLYEGIRSVRDLRGDDRCWMDLEKIFNLLPEGYTPPVRDSRVELELCKKFIASCHSDPRTIYVSPQRRIEELEEENTTLREINLGLAERVVKQSEILSRNAETNKMIDRNLSSFVKDRRDLIETLVRIADLVETQDFKQIQIEVTTAIDRMYPY